MGIYFKSEEKIIATENTEITEDFFSVSSVLSVADFKGNRNVMNESQIMEPV